MEQTAPAQTQWSAAVEAAGWIAAALAPFEEGLVASVIPRGFAAYARLLNPVRASLGRGTRPVRWNEIAGWSGVPLRPDSQFHSIALPPRPPAGPPPWNGQGPERGSLDLADAETLIKNADTAMYQAKEQGRDNYQLFNAYINAKALQRIALEHGLRRSLANNELAVHYQPIFDFRSGRMGVLD